MERGRVGTSMVSGWRVRRRPWGGGHGLLLESEAASLPPHTTPRRGMDPESHDLLIARSGHHELHMSPSCASCVQRRPG